jgi:tRNA dimethylallyltransferase
MVLLGPTGAGKTALSLAIAERFPSEIVSCDSVAAYRDFEIGTAKPSREQRRLVPHHLLDIVSPQETFTAGDYARRARQALAEIRGRGRLAIVVGGTGLYLRALLQGLFAGPARSEELRERLRELAKQRGSGHLHRVLRRLDAESAGRIHPHDAAKLIRAVEVCLLARQKISRLWQERAEALTGFRVLRIGLDPERKALYSRINHRAQEMFAAGLIEETRRLRERYGPEAAPLRALGYKQAVEFLDGEADKELALRRAQQAHRNYAKRQMTWFRREPGVEWLKGFGDAAEIQQAAIALVARASRS